MSVFASKLEFYHYQQPPPVSLNVTGPLHLFSRKGQLNTWGHVTAARHTYPRKKEVRQAQNARRPRAAPWWRRGPGCSEGFVRTSHFDRILKSHILKGGYLVKSILFRAPRTSLSDSSQVLPAFAHQAWRSGAGHPLQPHGQQQVQARC